VDTTDVPADNEGADPTSAGDRVLVAVGLEFEEQENFSLTDVLTYSLQASEDGTTFADFGYTTGQGQVSSQLIIVPDNNVFVQLPDTSDIVKLKLAPTDDSTPRTPTKVIGAYVVLSMLLLSAFIEFVGLHKMVARVLTTGIMAIFHYLMHKFITFSHKVF